MFPQVSSKFSFKDLFYLKGRDTELFLLLVHFQMAIMAGAGLVQSLECGAYSESPIQRLGPFSITVLHQQETRTEAEQPGLKLAPIQDTSTTGKGQTYYATTLPPPHEF